MSEVPSGPQPRRKQNSRAHLAQNGPSYDYPGCGLNRLFRIDHFCRLFARVS